jgi:hypothetical protein
MLRVNVILGLQLDFSLASDQPVRARARAKATSKAAGRSSFDFAQDGSGPHGLSPHGHCQSGRMQLGFLRRGRISGCGVRLVADSWRETYGSATRSEARRTRAA